METFMSICMQKMNSIPNFFLRYCKYIANLLLRVFWECLTMSINNDSTTKYHFDVQSVEINLWETLMFIYMQKINSNFFWDIVTTLRTCYFRNFGNAWHPHWNHTTNLWETFMLTCMQKINFITHFFHKILQRNGKLVILGNVCMPGHTHLKQ